MATAVAEKPDAKDDEASLLQYKAWFKLDREHSAPWRKEAKEDFEFLAGQQWTDQEKAMLKDQARPLVTFNRTNPIINAISGNEITNRQEVKFFPREQGDAKASELLTGAAEWFRDEANADDEDSDMFLDSVVCGLGGTETTIEFEDDDAGKPVVNCMNPLELFWDHAARKKNFTDANRKWRVRDVPVSRVRAMLDDEDLPIADMDAYWAKVDSENDDPTDRERARLYADEGEQVAMRDESMVTIVHLQYKKQVSVYEVMDPRTGKKQDISPEQHATLKKRVAGVIDPATGLPMQVISRKKKVNKIMTCLIGAKVLLETEAICPKHFSFQFVTASIDRNTGLPYGLMRVMKDPQRWANKWMSQAMHILNTNAKGGVMVEEDAVEDIREFEKTWSRNDKVTKVMSGALSGGNPKIQPKAQPSMDGSFFNMMQFAIQSVRDTTGVSVELLGMREATQAASLELQRKQAGLVGMAPLFDNLKRYRRDEGRVMLYLIQVVIPRIDEIVGNEPRLIRVTGEEGAKYVPLALKADAKYDIIVDDQVNTPEHKMQILQAISPYLPVLIKEVPEVMLELLPLLPIPTSLVEKINAAAKKKAEAAQNPEAQKGMQLELDRLSAEVQKLLTQAEKNSADAEQTRAETASQPIVQLMQALQPPQPAGAMNG